MKKKMMKCLAVPVMLAVCSVFYYFGELIDWAAWDALRRDFFYGIHDVHRLLFLAPIIYASYCGRVRGAVIVTMVAYLIFLPRAFFISSYPDALLRMSLFTLFAGALGVLVGQLRNECERRRDLENKLAAQAGRLPEQPHPGAVAGRHE